MVMHHARLPDNPLHKDSIQQAINANAGAVLIRISAELLSAGDRNTKFLKQNVTGDKPGVSYKILSVNDILCLWFRAPLIYINNCPTRCNTKQSTCYSASSLYMFRVSTTTIIRSTQNCNYSLRYWSYFLCSCLPPTWPLEVAAQKI